MFLSHSFSTCSEWLSKGLKVPDSLGKEEWDRNVITPGTPFMAKLTNALNYFIEHSLQTDPTWKHVSSVR